MAWYMVCAVHLSQDAHFDRVVLVPLAPQRTPPRSQIDCSVPHVLHLTIHARDSASIEAAVAAGKIALTIFWIKPIGEQA